MSSFYQNGSLLNIHGKRSAPVLSTPDVIRHDEELAIYLETSLANYEELAINLETIPASKIIRTLNRYPVTVSISL